MDFVSVVVGGALAIAGGLAAEWFAARARQRESERHRLEQYRRDATEAAVQAYEVVQQALPDALTMWSGKDESMVWTQVQALQQQHTEADRLLLRLRVGRPTATAATVAEAAEELRRRLRATARKSTHLAATFQTSEVGDFDQTQRLNDNAREQLATFEAALKDL